MASPTADVDIIKSSTEELGLKFTDLTGEASRSRLLVGDRSVLFIVVISLLILSSSESSSPKPERIRMIRGGNRTRRSRTRTRKRIVGEGAGEGQLKFDFLDNQGQWENIKKSHKIEANEGQARFLKSNIQYLPSFEVICLLTRALCCLMSRIRFPSPMFDPV